MQLAMKKHQCPHYQPNSDSALSPFEVKNINKKLLSSSCTNVHNLQIWVMMLAGMKLFLRGDEIIKSRHDDIVSELAVFNVNGSLECMTMNVLGKEEEEAPTTLAMWHERAMPFMDLTRHVLLL